MHNVQGLQKCADMYLVCIICIDVLLYIHVHVYLVYLHAHVDVLMELTDTDRSGSTLNVLAMYASYRPPKLYID